MKETHYDIIIAGAGLGGLSLINKLINNDLVDGKILVIDSDAKKSNDRTWSFWSEARPEFDCAEKNQWSQLGFASDGFLRYDNINPYTYYTIHGIDFYNEVFAKIGRENKVEFIQDNILEINDLHIFVEVKTQNTSYTANKVIDSVSRPEVKYTDSIINFQNFLGWTVTTALPVFDSKRPILMDFRVPQLGEVSFVYLLPFSENKALIEFTQFAQSPDFDRDVYRVQVRKYIKEILKLDFYTIQEEEVGVIPMTNYPFESRPSQNIYRIGTAGGDTKPTTGYTFTNVQEHAEEIILDIKGVRRTRQDKSRFAFYDDLLLEIIYKRPELVKPIITELFKNQPMSRVLRFLNEDTNLFEDALIFRMLPWSPFIKALMKSRFHVAAL